ncbi:MAG: hypothetical protein ACXACI_10985 [Candidatus Hodarchaeales archaeon]
MDINGSMGLGSQRESEAGSPKKKNRLGKNTIQKTASTRADNRQKMREMQQWKPV